MHGSSATGETFTPLSAIGYMIPTPVLGVVLQFFSKPVAMIVFLYSAPLISTVILTPQRRLST